MLALVRKRQLRFWRNLQKGEGTELEKLLIRAEKTRYIKHYLNLEKTYETPEDAYQKSNEKFYSEMMDIIKNSKIEQTKLNTYKNIYGINNDHLPSHSISLKCADEFKRKVLTRYILSSHNLLSEIGNWSGGDKICSKCSEGVPESLEHFIFHCTAYDEIRGKFDEFPYRLKTFFEWEHCGEVITLLHRKRGG